MTEPHVVILNGPAGVGKTTVGRARAALVPNGACIHGDELPYRRVHARSV